MSVVLLIISLILVLAGANYLVEGSSAIAKRIGLSDFIIGLTVVAIGTSAPELVISCISSFNGNADIAIGNVIGSNIFNVLAILGVTALVAPITLTSNNIKKDIPFGLLAAFVLCTLGCGTWLNNVEVATISRTDGVLLLCFYGVFMAYTIFSAQSSQPAQDNVSGDTESKKTIKIWLALVMIAGGLVALVYGGNLFVEHASIIAKSLGISDAVIAATIMAGGTSLPELATSLVAAAKKNTSLALGNVIGSNISNIFLVLGTAAAINPLNITGITPINFITLMVSSVLLFVTAFTFRRKEVDRTEGVIFCILYVAYVYLLIK